MIFFIADWLCIHKSVTRRGKTFGEGNLLSVGSRVGLGVVVVKLGAVACTLNIWELEDKSIPRVMKIA